MSYFKSKIHQSPISAGACPDPTGELTALQQIPQLDSTGLTSKGRERKRLGGRADTEGGKGGYGP